GRKTIAGMAEPLSTLFFDSADALRPGAPRLAQPPPRRADRAAPCGIAQERRDRLGECRRIVGLEEMAARREREPLGTDRRRDDRLGPRERLEDLEPGAAAEPERHHGHGRLGQLRPAAAEPTGDPTA